MKLKKIQLVVSSSLILGVIGNLVVAQLNRAAHLTLLPEQSTAEFDQDYKQALNGTSLHFRVRGTNPANPYLLVLHGGPGIGAHMYYPWGSSLEKLVNVVYLDQRGGGESARLHFANPNAPEPHEIQDYTFTNLVQDIEDVRALLKIDKWFVVGHSWGGMLGLEYVAMHPDHVLGYIHMDGLLAWPITQEDTLDGAEANLRQQLKSEDPSIKSQAQEQLKKIEEIRRMPQGPQRLLATIRASSNLHVFARPEAAQAYDRRVEMTMRVYRLRPPEYASEPLQALAFNRVNHLESRDERPLLANIRVPVLVLNGKRDPIITPKVAEMVHRGVRGSKILLFDDCGHFPFSEQFEGTTEAVLDFIRASVARDRAQLRQPY